jgi:hypothetical protein
MIQLIITDKEMLGARIIGAATLAAWIDELVGFKTRLVDNYYDPTMFEHNYLIEEYQ